MAPRAMYEKLSETSMLISAYVFLPWVPCVTTEMPCRPYETVE